MSDDDIHLSVVNPHSLKEFHLPHSHKVYRWASIICIFNNRLSTLVTLGNSVPRWGDTPWKGRGKESRLNPFPRALSWHAGCIFMLKKSIEVHNQGWNTMIDPLYILKWVIVFSAGALAFIGVLRLSMTAFGFLAIQSWENHFHIKIPKFELGVKTKNLGVAIIVL